MNAISWAHATSCGSHPRSTILTTKSWNGLLGRDAPKPPSPPLVWPIPRPVGPPCNPCLWACTDAPGLPGGSFRLDAARAHLLTCCCCPFSSPSPPLPFCTTGPCVRLATHTNLLLRSSLPSSLEQQFRYQLASHWEVICALGCWVRWSWCLELHLVPKLFQSIGSSATNHSVLFLEFSHPRRLLVEYSAATICLYLGPTHSRRQSATEAKERVDWSRNIYHKKD